MYYITDNEDRTKTVVLQFLRSELLNDLDQYGFVEGDVQKYSEGQVGLKHLDHGKHQTQDITQDGNIDLVTRWLDLALARCREALFPYSKVPVEDVTSLDDVLVETGTYTITLLVPGDFSKTTVTVLEKLIHELLVYFVLWRWLGITKPEGAEKWKLAADEMEEEIKRTLAKRCGIVYRPLRPF